MLRPARMHLGVIAAFVAVAIPSVIFARSNPLKPALSPSVSSSAPYRFDCGTYKGNEREAAGLHARYASDVRRSAASQSVDFVYNDVWIVEDDGTILSAGNNPFDADMQTLHFVPNVSGGYDVDWVTPSFDPVLGSDLGMGDDTSAMVALGFGFDFFATTWNDAYVSSNGVVSFGGTINSAGFFAPEDFFNTVPKIASFFMDLNPAAAGAVYHKAEATRHTFTWSGVPEFNTSTTNTFQLVLHDDDSFDISFAGIGTLSQSNGTPIRVGSNAGGSGALAMLDLSDDLPHSTSAGVGVYEEFLNLTNPFVNDVALMRRFYENFPDEFFQTVFFTNFPQTMAGFANEKNISNSVQGIGLGIFDNSGLYGSNGVLESRCNMNQLAAWPSSPTSRFFGSGNSFLTIMGQESGHRWGAFMNFEDAQGNTSNMILGRSDAHWSYYADVDHSCLEGGDWEFVQGDLYTTPTSIDYFGDLDEYAFGVRSPEEVTELFYLSSATNDTQASRSKPPPAFGVQAHGTRVMVTIDDIIAAEGPRVPAERPEKDLRQAFILVHQQGTTPTQQELDKLVVFREAWEPYFETAVDGRMSLNTSLTRTPPVGVIEGHVTASTSGEPVGFVISSSIERGFQQNIAKGGRYTYRYMADEESDTQETATLFFFAITYQPQTVVKTVQYGTTKTVDIQLVPDNVPAVVQSYSAQWVGYRVELRWTLFGEQGDLEFEVWRKGDGDPRFVALTDPTVQRSLDSFVFADVSVVPGRSYTYRVMVLEDGAQVAMFEAPVFVPSMTTTLLQNHPNPFNPVTTIPFLLAEASDVTVAVFDPSGKLVRTLYDGRMSPGPQSVLWDGRDRSGRPVGSGVYFYRLHAGRETRTMKMVLLK